MNKSKKQNAAENAVMRIEGAMTICQVLELKQQLNDFANQSPSCEIDLSAVSEIDTAGVQLLIHAKKVAANNQRQLHLTRHSPAVLDAFELLNLAAYFGDPLLIQASAGSTAGNS